MTVLALTPVSYAFIASRPKTKLADLRGYRAVALELDRHFADPVAVTKRALPFGTKWLLTMVARVMPIPDGETKGRHELNT